MLPASDQYRPGTGNYNGMFTGNTLVIYSSLYMTASDQYRPGTSTYRNVYGAVDFVFFLYTLAEQIFSRLLHWRPLITRRHLQYAYHSEGKCVPMATAALW